MQRTVAILLPGKESGLAQPVVEALAASCLQPVRICADDLDNLASQVAGGSFDAVLIDLPRLGPGDEEVVRRLCRAAPWTAQIVLLHSPLHTGHDLPAGGAPEESLIRAGAQDVIVLPDVGAAEFGRRLRFAMIRAQRDAERGRRAARLEAAITIAHDAVVITDRNRDIVFFNPAAEALFGYGAPEIVGRPLEILLPQRFHAAHPGQVAHYSRTAGRNRPLGGRGEVLGLKRDGTEFPAEVTISKIEDADGPLFTALVRDISERKQAEAELLAALDGERQANEELKAAQSQLIEAEKMASLGQLVAGVAHEINTPIGIARTTNSFLRDKTDAIARQHEGQLLRRKDFNRYLAVARDTTALLEVNLERAARLVQSFKQTAADQTADPRHAFDLARCLADTVSSLEPALNRASHSLTLLCPPDIAMDGYPGALSRVLGIFVMNSIDHAYADGEHGRLSITASLPDPDTVELTYTDDGRGIPPEHRAKVFEPFFTTRRGAGNTGLGLHIAYNLVNARFGGRIFVDSTWPRGTRFVLRLPRCAPEPPPEPPPAPGPAV